jgi:hypothetical protein
MMTCGGVEVEPTSALDWSKCSASRSGRFFPQKEPPYPLDGRLSGPQSRSGCSRIAKVFCPCRVSNPAVESAPRRYTGLQNKLKLHLQLYFVVNGNSVEWICISKKYQILHPYNSELRTGLLLFFAEVDEMPQIVQPIHKHAARGQKRIL